MDFNWASYGHRLSWVPLHVATMCCLWSKLLMIRAVKHWHRWPREMVDEPSLEIFKVRKDGALSKLIEL